MGVSGQGGEKALADKEGIMEVDLVDYESYPYESTMCDQALAVDLVFRVQYHSEDHNTPQDKVSFLCLPLYYVGLSFFCLDFLSSKRGYLFLFWRFRSMPYIYHINDRYSLSPSIGSMDVAIPSFILELEFSIVAL